MTIYESVKLGDRCVWSRGVSCKCIVCRVPDVWTRDQVVKSNYLPDTFCLASERELPSGG